MGNAAIAVQLLLGLLDRASAIGNLLKQAQDEQRDVTAEELDELVSADDAARASLDEAIEDSRQAPEI